MNINLRTLLLVGCLLLFGGIGCTPNESTIRHGRVPYDSFPNTYTITNGCVVVVVAPQVGRIIGYHRVGRENLLWLDKVPSLETTVNADMEWMNYGGDKVWIGPQMVWPDVLGRVWPPDFTIDGDPWTVLYADTRRLVMASNISPGHGARITRTITLPDDSTTVRIDHHLERVLDDPDPVQIWPVTQVLVPQFGLLNLAKDRPLGVRNIITSSHEVDMPVSENSELGVARCDWPDERSQVGTFGRWIAAVYPRTIFAQYADLDVSGEYDDMANCEIYSNPELKYVELELLSPAKILPAGESMDFTVTWKLLDRPIGMGLKGIVRQIESHAPACPER